MSSGKSGEPSLANAARFRLKPDNSERKLEGEF